jgi:hypothetical protein
MNNILRVIADFQQSSYGESLNRHLPSYGESLNRHLPSYGESLNRHLPSYGESLNRQHQCRSNQTNTDLKINTNNYLMMHTTHFYAVYIYTYEDFPLKPV